MNDLKTALEDYLAVRRKLGFKLYQAGNLLHDFVNYAEQQKASYITTKLAWVMYAALLSIKVPLTHARRSLRKVCFHHVTIAGRLTSITTMRL
jgi:hypothetical protein